MGLKWIKTCCARLLIIFKNFSRSPYVIVFIVISLAGSLLTTKFIKRFESSKNLVSETPLNKVVQMEPPPQKKEIKILFGGDMMFDRNIRKQAEINGYDYILLPLYDLLTQYDVVVANVEGPITASHSRSINSRVGSTNNFIFTFDPQVVPVLKKYNLNIVNIGNNHITNFGPDGILQTKSLLTSANINYFGNTGTENNSSERVFIKTFGDLQIAFVNYNQFVPDGYPEALEDIKYSKSLANIVILYTHWGNEYVPVAGTVIQNQAHEFIDLGADLIIGSHPHVIQQTEEYKGKRIYYSLGNFVFDQYFSAETQRGQLVALTINEDNSRSFQETYVTTQRSGQTQLEK